MAEDLHFDAIDNARQKVAHHDDASDDCASAQSGLTRRDMIKIATAAALAAPLVGVGSARAAVDSAMGVSSQVSSSQALQFFTPQEFALADELTELIIPTDDHSPGARAAQAAAYIDQRLAESWEEEPRQLWRAGLKLIDSISQQMHARAFLEATPAQRVEVLTRISQNEANPQKPEEVFFKDLKARTAHAYYTSKIGIHTEMQYKGNTYLKEFVGYDAK